MKKTLFATLALVATICNVNAQSFSAEDQAKIEKFDLVPSKVISVTGDTITGFLKTMKLPTAADFGFTEGKGGAILSNVIFPVEFGTKINFISAEMFNANENLKSKFFTNYEPEDLKGYIYDYTNTKKEFISIKIKCKDMNLKGQTFVEIGKKPVNGENYCTIYYPVSAYNNIKPNIKDIEKYTHTYPGLMNADSTEAILVTEQDPAEFYKTRCPKVAEKWNNGEYTTQADGNKKSSKGLSKYLATFDENTIDEAHIAAYNDFVTICGSKKK